MFSVSNWRYTSSALKWRTPLVWNSSRMRRRGPVAFNPMLRRPAGFCVLLCAASGGALADGTERGMRAVMGGRNEMRTGGDYECFPVS